MIHPAHRPTTTDALRVSDGAGLLSTVPALLGFPPTQWS
jgi:hypothetical protein